METNTKWLNYGDVVKDKASWFVGIVRWFAFYQFDNTQVFVIKEIKTEAKEYESFWFDLGRIEKVDQ